MNRTTHILMAIVLLAIVIRVVGAVYWNDRSAGTYHFGDSLSYHTLASAIATGSPYEYTENRYAIFRTPGYPILMAPIFWFFGATPPILLLRLENVLFSGIGLLLAAWGAFRFTENRDVAPGFVLTVLAISPGAIAISFLVLTESAFIPWMLSTLFSLNESIRQERRLPRIGLSLWCGISSAIATLIRPSWLLCLPGILVFLVLFRCGIPRNRSVGIGIGVLVGMVAILTPWWFRNAIVTNGRFVATSLQTGTSLLDGWNSEADGSSCWEPVQRVIDSQSRLFRERYGMPPGDAPADLRIQFELEMNDVCATEAKRWAIENPGRVLSLAIQKIGRLWNPIPNESSLQAVPLMVLSILLYLPVVVGALISVVLEWRRRDALGRLPILLYGLPILYFTFIHSIFVSSIRYREPLIPLLAILASPLMVSIFHRRSVSDHRERFSPTAR